MQTADCGLYIIHVHCTCYILHIFLTAIKLCYPTSQRCVIEPLLVNDGASFLKFLSFLVIIILPFTCFVAWILLTLLSIVTSIICTSYNDAFLDGSRYNCSFFKKIYSQICTSKFDCVYSN